MENLSSKEEQKHPELSHSQSSEGRLSGLSTMPCQFGGEGDQIILVKPAAQKFRNRSASGVAKKGLKSSHAHSSRSFEKMSSISFENSSFDASGFLLQGSTEHFEIFEHYSEDLDFMEEEINHSSRKDHQNSSKESGLNAKDLPSFNLDIGYLTGLENTLKTFRSQIAEYQESPD